MRRPGDSAFCTKKRQKKEENLCNIFVKKVLTNSVLYGIIYTERERKGERKMTMLGIIMVLAVAIVGTVGTVLTIANY